VCCQPNSYINQGIKNMGSSPRSTPQIIIKKEITNTQSGYKYLIDLMRIEKFADSKSAAYNELVKQFPLAITATDMADVLDQLSQLSETMLAMQGSVAGTTLTPLFMDIIFNSLCLAKELTFINVKNRQTKVATLKTLIESVNSINQHPISPIRKDLSNATRIKAKTISLFSGLDVTSAKIKKLFSVKSDRLTSLNEDLLTSLAKFKTHYTPYHPQGISAALVETTTEDKKFLTQKSENILFAYKQYQERLTKIMAINPQLQTYLVPLKLAASYELITQHYSGEFTELLVQFHRLQELAVSPITRNPLNIF
jgi:hypothetical protein